MLRAAGVTGPTGGIGSAVCAALDAAGWEVLALRRGDGQASDARTTPT